MDEHRISIAELMVECLAGYVVFGRGSMNIPPVKMANRLLVSQIDTWQAKLDRPHARCIGEGTAGEFLCRPGAIPRDAEAQTGSPDIHTSYKSF